MEIPAPPGLPQTPGLIDPPTQATVQTVAQTPPQPPAIDPDDMLPLPLPPPPPIQPEDQRSVPRVLSEPSVLGGPPPPAPPLDPHVVSHGGLPPPAPRSGQMQAAPTAPTIAPLDISAIPELALPPRPETEPVKPLTVPPFLASETATRAHAPIEPWREALKLLMPIAGIILLAGFAAPWGVIDSITTFGWTGLSALAPSEAIVRLLLPGTGILALLFGLLPMTTTNRGIAAIAIGTVPLAMTALLGKSDGMTIGVTIGAALCIVGLLIRSQYKAALLGRLLATLGVLCIGVTLVVPIEGAMPISTAFTSIQTGAIYRAASTLGPLILAGLALLAWLPASSGGGARFVAWLWIGWSAIAAGLGLIASSDVFLAFVTNIHTHLWAPLATVAWLTLVGFGVATVAGKLLEHR